MRITARPARPHSSARASGFARSTTRPPRRRAPAAGYRAGGARRRPLHDGSAVRRRPRPGRGPAVRRAAARHLRRTSSPRLRSSVGRLEPVPARRARRRLVGLYLRRADRVVAIGDTMRLPTRGEGRTARAHPRDPELGRHAKRPAASARQRLGARARARRDVRRHALGQRRPRTEPRRAGACGDASCATSTTCGRHRRLRRATRRGPALASVLDVGDRVRFLPYQPREVLPAVALGGRRPRRRPCAGACSGYVVPSRLYGVSPPGGRSIAAAEDESETARLVARRRLRRGRPAGRPGARSQRRSGDSARGAATISTAMGRARPRLRRRGGGAASRARPLPRAAPRRWSRDRS